MKETPRICPACKGSGSVDSEKGEAWSEVDRAKRMRGEVEPVACPKCNKLGVLNAPPELTQEPAPAASAEPSQATALASAVSAQNESKKGRK